MLVCRRKSATWVMAASLLWATRAWADGDSLVVRAGRDDGLPDERAHSTVNRSELERRQPRSAPDALRYESGVFVQQTAHGQGSAFIRGLTGQQTLLLFDGIRVNNSTYRQGPNQYFFTIDSRTIDTIEVLRGGGSTRYGSDALGGVIAAYPIDPLFADGELLFRPQLQLRSTSADDELGGRAQVHLSGPVKGGQLGFVGGVGYRDVGLLKSGGRVENPNPNTPLGRYPLVPAYAKDGVTQLGTGFKELTADGRLVLRLGELQRLVLATYHYMQFDVPRTDQCPPPYAPMGTCLTYEQQFRHLVYLTYEGKLGTFLWPLRVSVSLQVQHEKQRMDDPSVLVVRRGSDNVMTLGVLATGQSKPLALSPKTQLQLRYGFDQYMDWLRSDASRTFTDLDQTAALSRGQYINGSSYLTGGLYADGVLSLPRQFDLYGGVRWSYVVARADAEPLSGSQAVAQSWYPVVGNVGLSWKPVSILTLRLNADHSFRAANLNDLTARQQTGPGFQFENAALRPERATTFELGAVIEHSIVSAQIWGFETLLQDAVLKVSKTDAECPPSTPECVGAWTRFQLQNAPALSELRGVEAMLRLRLPYGLRLRGTAAYTWGEGPRVGILGYGTSGVVLGDRVPLSRVPPLHGSAEAIWQNTTFELSAGLRWATTQDRLAIADYADARIPKYGTPGFVVVDLRSSVRLHDRVQLLGVLENVGNVAYRYHGSSVNGPGRGFILSLKVE
jgi:iron complex outermembrane receptor protein/hemoglobin/transferrin/lactoferrin receptor protein